MRIAFINTVTEDVDAIISPEIHTVPIMPRDNIAIVFVDSHPVKRVPDKDIVDNLRFDIKSGKFKAKVGGNLINSERSLPKHIREKLPKE